MATAICCTSNVTLTVGDNTLPKTRKQQEELAIEKGVPAPISRNRSVYGRTAEKMQPGDSIFFASIVDARRMRDALRYRSIKYCCRKTDNGLGWRIWRLA